MWSGYGLSFFWAIMPIHSEAVADIVCPVFAPQREVKRAFAERGRLERELWTKQEIKRGDLLLGAFQTTVVLETDQPVFVSGGVPTLTLKQAP